MTDPSDLITEAYDLYADAIFRHCYLRLMNRERGKDIMHDTFIKAFEYAKKGKEIENIRALLYKIANNLIIDYVRKAKEMSLDQLQESGFDPSNNDGTEFGKTMDERVVIEKLSCLDKDDRELIVLRFVDNMKPQEIAAIMDLEPNTVSVRIHRALKQLKTVLKKP